MPESWGYAWFRRFHAPSSGVLVPTEGMREILQGHRFERLRAWSHGVDLSLFKPVPGVDFGLPRPVWLYLGRVSYEKNLEAFLALDLPGTKLVYGTGPLRDALVAAFPEAGPLDVVGSSAGGVLDHDLRAASLKALALDRGRVRDRALQFYWSAVCEQFLGHLVPAVTEPSQKLHKLVS